MKKRVIIISGVILVGFLVMGSLYLFWPKTVTVLPSENSSSKVLTLSLGHFNTYLIQTDDGYILVDTGMAGDDKVLEQAISEAGINPQDINLIIITHAHPDHVGSVARMKEITGADVLCHEYAAPLLRAGKASPIIAHDLVGKFLNIVTPRTYPSVEPDVVFQDEFDLTEYGIDGRVIHTPGHTQDSATIILGNGEMLLGDLVRETDGKIHIGRFYEDTNVLTQSLETLATHNASKIYMSHGTSLDTETLQQTIENIKE
ncbi:MAG: MBL fold metallo-hydrolase [Chloroflexi bacterium]|nr:MBL fold metallo-hydrolase [Chloroflexota bacterium]